MPAKSVAKHNAVLDLPLDIYESAIALALVLVKETQYVHADEVRSLLIEHKFKEMFQRVICAGMLGSVERIEKYLNDVLERATNDVEQGLRDEGWLLDIAYSLKIVNRCRKELVGIQAAIRISDAVAIDITDDALRIQLQCHSRPKVFRAVNTFHAIITDKLSSA